MQTYHVKLDMFEGPLDLLSHLIKKNKYNIFDIPIAEITEQYLHYLEEAKDFINFDMAGDFISEAANLINIKSKMLLNFERNGGNKEVEDPRNPLVKRLLEHQFCKEMSTLLWEKQKILWRDTFKRKSSMEEGKKIDYFVNINNNFDISALIEVLTDMIKKMPQEMVYEITTEKITIQDRIKEIIELLKKQTKLTFSSLILEAKKKYEIILTFLAILELTKLKMVCINQKMPYEDIEVLPNIA